MSKIIENPVPGVWYDYPKTIPPQHNTEVSISVIILDGHGKHKKISTGDLWFDFYVYNDEMFFRSQHVEKWSIPALPLGYHYQHSQNP